MRRAGSMVLKARMKVRDLMHSEASQDLADYS